MFMIETNIQNNNEIRPNSRFCFQEYFITKFRSVEDTLDDVLESYY